MGNDELVTIAKFGSSQDAQLRKGILEGQGIRAFVADDVTTMMLWYVGTALGGAKLQVARTDVARASQVLQVNELGIGTTSDRAQLCPHCGAEVDAGFEVCWSCEGSMPELAASDAPAFSPESDVAAIENDDSHSFAREEKPADANATRAFRAAIFGMLFPPLLLYAAYLVVKLIPQELSPPAMRKFGVALLICVTYAILLVTLGRHFLGL